MTSTQRASRRAVRVFAVAIATAAAGMAALANADLARETRAVAGFDRILLRSVGDLVIDEGATESFTAEAERKVLANLRTRVDGGTLVIELVGSVSTRLPIRYRVTVKQLRGFASEGSNETTINRLKTAQLDLRLSGSGTINAGALTARSVTVKSEGSGDIKLAGSADELRVAMDGAGEFDGAKLATARASVAIAGASSVRVRASESLDVDLSGSGEVTYYGSPRVRQSITGAGSVTKG
jgi:hypothetical protein